MSSAHNYNNDEVRNDFYNNYYTVKHGYESSNIFRRKLFATTRRNPKNGYSRGLYKILY
jgi:hypothetical protein